jgi:hypothetical protein
MTSAPPIARKLDQHEEDEDDKRERHRLEASLKLMGISRPSPTPSLDDSRSKSPPTSYWSSKKIVSTPSQISEEIDPPPKRGTPLSRLSSALGFSPSPMSPPLDTSIPIDPDLAEAALRAFDEREAEQVKAIAEGKSPAGYTSPSKISRRMSLHRTHSSQTVEKRHEGPEKGKMPKSESVSTLWSIGGSSRPPSGEVQPTGKDIGRQ